MNLLVIGPKDTAPADFEIINTTSKDKKGLGGQLSPFYLGPVPLYEDMVATNLENAWQFSKVYPEHFDKQSNTILESYFTWAKKGWSDSFAHRYPMGKGKIPLFSYWKTFNSENQHWQEHRWTYIDARTNIYIPLYAKLIYKTSAFKKLKTMLKFQHKIALWDFDGYDFEKRNMTFKDVVFCEKYKCGHAFVIYGLLTEQIIIDKNENVIFNFK